MFQLILPIYISALAELILSLLLHWSDFLIIQKKNLDLLQTTIYGQSSINGNVKGLVKFGLKFGNRNFLRKPKKLWVENLKSFTRY